MLEFIRLSHVRFSLGPLNTGLCSFQASVAQCSLHGGNTSGAHPVLYLSILHGTIRYTAWPTKDSVSSCVTEKWFLDWSNAVTLCNEACWCDHRCTVINPYKTHGAGHRQTLKLLTLILHLDWGVYSWRPETYWNSSEKLTGKSLSVP